MPEEMTNQSLGSTETTVTEPTSSTDDWDLFSDDEVDQLDETSEENEEQEINEAQEETAPFLKIKYNGAEENLTQEEAIALAQKGRNYDKVYSELQSLKNSQEMQILNDLASTAGVSLSQYLSNLQSFQTNGMIQQIADGLKEKYPDSSEELIHEMAKAQYEKLNADKQQKKIETEKSAEQSRKEGLNRQINALLEEYPDVDITKLPDEVIALAAQGETLIGAYRAYELKSLKEKYSTLETEKNNLIKNRENRKKSTGSMIGKAGNEALDPFLEGLNS